MSQAESKILRDCLLGLSRLGATVWRNDTGAIKGENGWISYGLCKGSSDIIGLYQGRFLAVEVKTPQGRLSDKQRHFLQEIQRKGGIAFVCDDAKKLKKLLDDHV